ncbi:putative glycosyltransferase [Bacillus sp. TS-2]|nr:putative glycosyltransferase [Bacillus sp. TS-2]
MKNVILFGASALGEIALRELNKQYNVIFFCDNDPKKIHTKHSGITIISPLELNDYREALVIITSIYTLDIAEQLVSLEIKCFAVFDRNPSSNQYQVTEYHFDSEITEQMNAMDICLITTSNSGSNVLALNKLIPKRLKQTFNITLLQSDNFFKDYSFFNEVIKNKLLIFDVRSPDFKTKSHLFIQLWHGFPLKGLGTKSKGAISIDNWEVFDKVASYSELYNKIIGESFFVPEDKFMITGLPRNDWLFLSEGRKILENSLDISLSKNKKVVFYMPTYRNSSILNERSGKRTSDNIFGFSSFNSNTFTRFLEEANILLVMKLHPLEESKYHHIKSDSIYFLSDPILNKKQIDLYEILNGVDLLITDYSSVYIDYLLLNRPIIFTPTDLMEYRATRGFSFPYEEYTPGPKVTDQNSLQSQILKLLANKHLYEEERVKLLEVFHHHKDNRATERVWLEIEEMLN